MNAFPDNRTLHAEASAPARVQHPQVVALMNTSAPAAANAKALRILVPINANDDSHWGIRYAMCRHREGMQVEVILLNIGEPVTEWQVLRFRTQQEIARLQS